MTASPWLRKLLLTALSLWLTSIAVVVLLEHTGSVAAVSTRAADPATDPAQLTGDLPHALGGLLLVCVPLVRNIYKPRGLTAAASAIGTDTRQPHRDASGSAALQLHPLIAKGVSE